ncbi:hypothetical protein N007_08580 [Alicyclobacillus acidoterrestris ATCC 49025]|nr:hypothetical protein N007_08580 [Alicyclobacillus acidoterrestris ATCC 49025]
MFILFLVLYQRKLGSYQEFEFIAAVTVVELLRGTVSFRGRFSSWLHFSFIEGAFAIGRTPWGIMLHTLRPWLWRFTIEFFCIQVIRTISLLVQLAAFRIYPIETYGYPAFYPGGYSWHVEGIVPKSNTWFSMIGDLVHDMSYISYPYMLYAPLIALGLVVVGVSLVSSAFRQTV